MSDILLLSMLVGLLYAYIQERSLRSANEDNSVNSVSPATSTPPDGGGFFSLFSRGFTLFFVITAITEIMGERLITQIDGFMEAVPKITGAVLVIYAVLEGKRKAKEITAGKNAGRFFTSKLNLFCNRCVIPPDISQEPKRSVELNDKPSKED